MAVSLSTHQAEVPVIRVDADTRVALVIGVTTEEDMGSLVCISIFVSAANKKGLLRSSNYIHHPKGLERGEIMVI